MVPVTCCKSWQNDGYIQLPPYEIAPISCCKSWQNDGYIQLNTGRDTLEDAVSHGKMMGTSNELRPMMVAGHAVSHGKMMGTSNPPTVRPSGSQAVSHGKKESTSSKSDSLHQKKEHPFFRMLLLLYIIWRRMLIVLYTIITLLKL